METARKWAVGPLAGDGTRFAHALLVMKRHLILGVLLAAGGLVAPAAAQRLHIGIDRGGVHVGGEVQIGGRRGPVVSFGEGRVPYDQVRYETQRVRVWVPGCQRIEHVPARWGWRRDACGRLVRVCISPAYDRVVQEPGHWEWRDECVPVRSRGAYHRGYR